MKQSSSRTPGQPADQPSNAIHRLSEVVPRFRSLNSSSAANQVKTEYRRGEFLEQLVSQKYPRVVAEEHINFIRDSFTSFNESIKELHNGVPKLPKRRRKSVAKENGMDAKTYGKMTMDVDNDKDGDYNGDGGATSRQLTAEQEAEDEEHWRQAANDLSKDTTMTEYYIEMGYQIAPSPPKEELKVQDQQELPRLERKTHAKKWVPRLVKNNRRAALLPPNIEQQSNDASLYNTVPEQNVETTGNLPAPMEPSLSSSSMPPPPKRAKMTSSSPTRSNFGLKPPPRCASCVQMKKNCDRQSPCGRCAGMRDYKVCTPYWRDL